MKFSIIVPVYNVGKYLPKCLDSLICQDYHDYEILLVDDGSTDESGLICDDYANKCRFIQVFHKENGGLSDARNYGIAKSNGQYLIFVDADDYIVGEFLSVFDKSLAENTEVLITRFVEVFPNTFIPRDVDMSKKLKRNPSKKEAVDWIMSKSYNTWPAQKYVVSRSFVNENHLMFKKKFFHEDIDWTSKICLFAENFMSCDIEWYCHRMERPGSIMNCIKSKRITDVIKIAYDLDVLFEENTSCDLAIKKMIARRIMRSVYPTLNLCGKVRRDEIPQIASVVDECWEIFSKAPGFKYQIFYFLMRILGSRFSLQMLSRL